MGTDLVVLDLEALGVALLPPLLVFGHGKEAERLLSLGRLHNGRDELSQEPWESDERGPEVVDEVDDETLRKVRV